MTDFFLSFWNFYQVSIAYKIFLNLRKVIFFLAFQWNDGLKSTCTWLYKRGEKSAVFVINRKQLESFKIIILQNLLFTVFYIFLMEFVTLHITRLNLTNLGLQ